MSNVITLLYRPDTLSVVQNVSASAYFAGRIVNANHSVMWAAAKLARASVYWSSAILQPCCPETLQCGFS